MKYRKRPVAVEVVQFNGTNYDEVIKFTDGKAKQTYPEMNDWFIFFIIKTLEGSMEIKEGDYIIKGILGEFYPCKPDVFELTYDKVE